MTKKNEVEALKIKKCLGEFILFFSKHDLKVQSSKGDFNTFYSFIILSCITSSLDNLKDGLKSFWEFVHNFKINQFFKFYSLIRLKKWILFKHDQLKFLSLEISLFIKSNLYSFSILSNKSRSLKKQDFLKIFTIYFWTFMHFSTLENFLWENSNWNTFLKCYFSVFAFYKT